MLVVRGFVLVGRDAAARRDGVPHCDCGAPLKPDVVLFGEFLPEAAIERAQALASSAGLMLAVGSSLEVWPVAQLPADTLDAGGRLALVTMGPTPYDSEAVVKLTGDVEEELSAVVLQLPARARERGARVDVAAQSRRLATTTPPHRSRAPATPPPDAPARR